MVSNFKEVAEFVESTEDVVWREDGKKVVFSVSGQEFDPQVGVDTLRRYYTGKSYRRACMTAKNKGYDFEALRPHIVPHKENNQFLFCWLTRSVLPLNCEVVEKHINGKKFIRLKKEDEKRVEEKRIMKENREKNKEAKDGDIDMDFLRESIMEDDDDDDDDMEVEMKASEQSDKKRKKMDSKKKSGRHSANAKLPKMEVVEQPMDESKNDSQVPNDSLSLIRAKLRKKSAKKRGVQSTR